MDEDQAQDVQETQVEGETTTASSSGSETPQDAPESAGSAKSTADVKTVPYERFKEVNESVKSLKAELEEIKRGSSESARPTTPQDPQVEAAKAKLKELGFVPKDEVERLVSEQIKQTREDITLDSQLSQLEKRYSGKDGRPRFDRQDVVDFAIENGISDPEVAYKVKYEKELINWHISNAASKTKGTRTEASDGSGSANAGTTNQDLKERIAKGDKEARRTFLKRFMPQ